MKIIIFLFILNNILNNYYEILGIKRNASIKEIKKAYKKKAIQYHPDRVSPKDKNNAEKQFQKVQNAYEVLNDPQMRSIYNRYGEKGVKEALEEKNANEAYEQRRKSQEEEYKRQTREHDILHDTKIEKINLENLSKFYRRINTWIILFYQPEEENLQFLKDILFELYERSDDIYNVLRIDCDEEEELCHEFKVYETPKLLIFKSSSNKDFIEINYKEHLEDKSKLISLIRSNVFNFLEDFVRIVNSLNYNDFIMSSNKLKVLLFSQRKTTPPILKVLSKEFKSYIDFGLVKVNYEQELTNKFQINFFPSLISIKDPNNHLKETFDGEISKSNITIFLRKKIQELSNNPVNLKMIYNYKNLLNDKNLCSIGEKNFCLFIVSNTNKLANEINNNFQEDPINIIHLKTNEINTNFIFDELQASNIDKNNYAFVLRSKRRKGMMLNNELSYENIKTFLEFYISGGINYKPFKKDIRDFLNETKNEL